MATMSPEEQLEVWAGALCTATDELEGAVSEIASSIDIDITAGLDQLPLLYSQLQTGVAEVDEAIDGVESVLNEVPTSSPEAVTFAQEVGALVASARASGDDAIASAQQAVDASNFLAAGLAAASAVSAARSAYNDASQARTMIDEVRSGGPGPIGEAFGAAPECS